jgi:hypothetical protein
MGKKKAPEGAFPSCAQRAFSVLVCRRLVSWSALLWQYTDPFSVPIQPVELDDAVYLGKNRVIPPHTNVLSWVNSRPQLPNDDVPGAYSFAAEHLDPASLALAVTAVS